MALEYRHDPDLEFLGSLDGDALDPLVDILTKKKNSNLRRNQNLTSESRYKEHAPNHAKYWDLIAAEMQTWHGHALWNRWRGAGDKQGVLYRDILHDVCDRKKVNYNKKSETEVIEEYLCQKVLTEKLESMTSQQVKDFVEDMNLHTANLANFHPSTVATAAIGLFRAGGFESYKWAVIIANLTYNATFKQMIGKGLSLTANATLTKSLSRVTSPHMWAITALLAANHLAGPAHRVTTGAVIMISCLRVHWRQRHSTESPNEATE